MSWKNGMRLEDNGRRTVGPEAFDKDAVLLGAYNPPGEPEILVKSIDQSNLRSQNKATPGASPSYLHSPSLGPKEEAQCQSLLLALGETDYGIQDLITDQKNRPTRPKNMSTSLCVTKFDPHHQAQPSMKVHFVQEINT